MDSYELDNNAYSHMRENGIHRTKRSGPRKGQVVHETVSGKPFKGSALKKRTVPKHYQGNTNSEGGIPFGKKPN